MNMKKRYFKIGIFVLSTIVLLVAGVMTLSFANLGEKKVFLETYIDESVLGLNVGSPVMQRGVKIGRVEKITFVPLEYNFDQGSEKFNKYGKYVMVVMAIEGKKFPAMPHDDTQTMAIIDRWIANGLRLKLSYQGITGIAYIEADYVDPDRFKPIIVPWDPKYIYIPSSPSVLSNFTQAADNFLQRLDHIDFEGMAKTFTETLETLNKAVVDVHVVETRKDILGLIAEIRETNLQVQKLMDKSKSDENGANIPEAIAQFNTTLKSMDKFVLSQKSEVEEIVTNIKRASANLRELTEFAKKYPSQVLFSPAPPHSEVVK